MIRKEIMRLNLLSKILYILVRIGSYTPVFIIIIIQSVRHKLNPKILLKTNTLFPHSGIFTPKSAIDAKFSVNGNSRYFAKLTKLSCTSIWSVNLEKVEEFMIENKINYPIILKPENSVEGIGLRYIENRDRLKEVLPDLSEDYIAQEYVSWPHELSVFYLKYPSCPKGKIWSITERIIITESKNDPKIVAPHNRIYYNDLTYMKTVELDKVFLKLSSIDGFNFGRFDVKVRDMNEFLLKGSGFMILEVNLGATSMALHAFENKWNLFKMYKVINEQFAFALEIASENMHDVSRSQLNQDYRIFIHKYFTFIKSTFYKL